MLERRNALLAACVIIAICISTITAMTYSLFTDTVSVTNHLKAGTLDVDLTRTNLEYCVIGPDGLLTVYTVSDEYDFTQPTGDNIFGLDSADVKVVPGCYFETTLELANNGNLACVYSVEVELKSGDEDLAEQLLVTMTYPDNSKVSKYLSELTQGDAFNSVMTASATTQQFKVRVEFVDDVKQGVSHDNDDAQGKEVIFDLTVSAVQATQQQQGNS